MKRKWKLYLKLYWHMFLVRIGWRKDDDQHDNYFDMINEDTFYGWPIESNIGGDHLCRDVVGLTKYDNHPNEEDHKMMAERLKEFIDKNILLDIIKT